jgi:uncharacterized repeat protein (TIGR01451 family)
MKINRTALCTPASNSSSILRCLGLVLLLAFASLPVVGQAFTFINPPTTTSSYATPVTAPVGGVILPGANINAVTGQHVRYLWYGDGGAVGGLCRVDPDVDSAGPHAINTATCVSTVNGVALSPAQVVYDPATQNVYSINTQKASQGVFRFTYDPNSDGGNGLIAPAATELAGIPSGKVVNVGCPFSSTLVTPAGLALGPDGSLYTGFKRGSGGAIYRIKHPSAPVDTANCGDTVAIMANTPDHKLVSALAFAGHDLYGGDGVGAFMIPNADTCTLAAQCPAQRILQVGALPVAVTSDQVSSQPNGHNVYFASATAVTWLGNINGTGNQTVASPFGGSGSNIAALAVDGANPVDEVLYFGDDPSAAGTVNAGRIFSVTQTPPPPSTPGAPIHVKAVAAPTQATVSWDHAADLQLVTSYVVHASFTSDGSVVPDVTVSPDAVTQVLATSATVTGLTNGVSYQFTVTASNALGSSPASTASNTVTPQQLVAPDAPTGVLAVAGDALAQVSWTAPANDGGSPITGYTVTALVSHTPTAITTTTADGSARSAFVTGLTNGTAYTFTVHATNAIGNSPESAESNSITPSQGTLPPDLSVVVSSPGTVDPNTQVPFVVTVTNNGPSPAAHVLVSDTFGGQGVTLVSIVPAQGTCVTAPSLSCDLGFLTAGASTTVTVTLQFTNAGATNVASVSATDDAGIAYTDPTPSNNTGSSSTGVNPPATTTTDVQVTGSASNGGPAVGSTINYTWQVKNAQSQAANGLVFTDVLPASLRFNSVSATLGGVCTGPAAGSNGGTVSCSLDSLSGGQTMIVTINVTVTLAGTIANKGSATFNGTDTNTANNSFTVNINAK